MKSLISILCIYALFASSTYADEGHGNAAAGEEQADSVGMPMPGAAANRSVRVTLNDQMKILFAEDLDSIRSGEVIQFVVTNEGKIPHEFSIGSEAEREEHAEMMRNMPGMVHNDGSTLTLAPGATASLTWHFAGDDEVVFSCNIPGHYEAGMFHEAALVN